jgi:alkanesulfonate monooxygenase SsuD/methylene tetrahydromethanopterin reductase-like flavin-dependent oxidoreductase (luciferase family)
MLEVWLRYDLKTPSFGTPRRESIAAALEQVAWADDKGFHTVQLPEHHGSTNDGYNPSPMILGAAFAARTKNMRLHPSAIILPLHDPVRVAEDACVLDNISDGRLDLTIAVGYVPSEFAMFGVSLQDRARLIDEKLAVIESAFAGRPFEYGARRGTVAPPPVQPEGPPIYIGGSVAATAKRAARFGTGGYYPMECKPEFVQSYKDACIALGKTPRRVIDCTGPQAVWVSRDPDRAWASIAPHAQHEADKYQAWAAELGQFTNFHSAPDPDALRTNGTYLVVTPEECLAFARAQRDAGRYFTMAPLTAGLDPAVGWESLELFASEVMPALQADEAK